MVENSFEKCHGQKLKILNRYRYHNNYYLYVVDESDSFFIDRTFQPFD